MKKIFMFMFSLAMVFVLASCTKKQEEKPVAEIIPGSVEAIDLADAYVREDYTSVYDVFGAETKITDVTEKSDGSATITKDGVEYTLGLDFLSMAMVYNCTPGGEYETEEEVYNMWWKLYIQRWNKLMPEVPLYSNQYYDVFNDKITNFKTNPYWGVAEAIVGAKSADKKVIIGNTTELSGYFRESAFGKSSPAASDQDISKLTTGYSTVASDVTGTYKENAAVVQKIDKIYNEDGTLTFEIEIKSGLKDSKGQEITADNYLVATLVANTPVYAAAGGNGSGSISIVGYKQILSYNGANAGSEGVSQYFSGLKKLGEYKFSVTLVADYAGYYYSIANAGFSPVDPAIYLCGAEIVVAEDGSVGLSSEFYAKETKDGQEVFKHAAELRSNILDTSTKFAYTGPYMVQSYDASNKVATLVKNPHYVPEPYRMFEEKEAGDVEQISYIKIISKTQIDQLQRGELDVISGITGGKDTDAALAVCAKGGFSHTYYDRAGYGKLAFKGDYGATQFVEVRQAITHLINRESFAQTFTGGYGTVVNGPYYSGSGAYKANADVLKINTYDYSLDAAKELLEQGGWVYSFDGKNVTKYTGTGVRYKKLAAEEVSVANIQYRSKDNAYKTIKYGGSYYMPLVINWFGTPADENEVTALLKTTWETSKASKDAGFYITSTEGDFMTVLYGEYYQMEAYGYNKGDAPICSCVNFATGFNSAVYDMSLNWSINPDIYWDYNSVLMDPVDFYADYQ